MGFHETIADRRLSRRRKGWAGTIVLTATAVAAALGAAAWITRSDLSALASAALPANSDRTASFEDRFFPASIPTPTTSRAALQPLDRTALDETRLRAAKNLLAPQLMSLGIRGGFVEASLGDPRFNDANAKLVDGKIDELKQEMQASRTSQNGIRHEITSVFQEISGIHATLVRHEGRLDRIEKRLELNDAPTLT